MNNKKTTQLLALWLILALAMVLALTGCGGEQGEDVPDTPGTPEIKELPAPEITGGARGEFLIDKSINEATLDEYLGRDDVVYRDMRMLEDPAQYENLGGDRFLSGYVEGFEVVPLPYLLNVSGLPNAVGETYTGDTLFSYDGWRYTANYEESMSILEELFPKDKVIFLMCGGGGYAGMTKQMLIALGWDPEKLYNVGGHWFYQGEHNIEVKKEENGSVTYDFESVPYHDIDFSSLTPVPEPDEDYWQNESEVAAEGLWISTGNVELEEGTSFQIKQVVLPNGATNITVCWSSSDTSVAYVDWNGLVKGVNPGTATLTAMTEDGGFTKTCEVTVTERADTEHVVLSDLTEEAAAFKENDPNAIMGWFDEIDSDMEKAVEEGYYVVDEDGGYTATDLWNEKYDELQAEVEKAIGVRIEILNKLVAEQKNFILLIYTKDCEGREYQATDGAVKMLDEKGIQYFYTSDMVSGYDRALYDSNLDYNRAVTSSVVIMKDGQIYATMNPDVDSIKSDEELENWFGKYIDIE